MANRYPIYVGEWGSGGVIGQPDANAAASNQQLLAYLNNHPNFSWTAWALTPDLGGEYNLLTAWDAASTTSDYGAYVKADLAAHRNDQAPPIVPPNPGGAGQPVIPPDGGAPTGGVPNPAAPAPGAGQPHFPSTTIGAYNPATAAWFLRSQNSPGAPDAGPFAFGVPGWIPLAGDWSGTGHAGIGVYDPATGTFYLRNETNAGPADAGIFQFGLPGWIPVIGDWSGTGHAGIGVVDPSTGTWYLRNEAGAGAPDAGVFPYGAPGWVPVVGDWNGDGKVTAGVVDPATMTWYLRNENSGGTPDVAAPFRYGLPGWKPLVGDWTGRGRTGIGVFEPDGTWLLRNTASPGIPDSTPFAYGVGTWTPVVGSWILPPQTLLAAGGARTISPDRGALSPSDLAAVVNGPLSRLSTAGMRRTEALDQVFAADSFGPG